MVRRTAAVVCLTTLAAGCGGQSRRQETIPKTPLGFTLRVVNDPGFAIAVPRRWRSLDAQQALSSAQTRAFAKANPELRSEVDALAKPDSPIKLLAVEPNAPRGFTTSLNVLQTRLPPKLSFEKWSAAEIAQIKLVPTAGDIHHQETRLAAGRTLRLTYRAKFRRQEGSFEAVIQQYLVKHEHLLYVLTYTTLPANETRYRKTFDASAHTFRLTSR